MRKLKLIGLILLCLWIAPFAATAGDYDGSKSLLCAPINVIECISDGECQKVTNESVGLPAFLSINFAEKKISPAPKGESTRNTAIKNMEHIDGKLILNGAEDGIEGVRDGLGWSMAIGEETGKMVLTGSGDHVGFVIFGACIPL